MSIVDLLSVAPFYLAMLTKSSGGGFAVVRILRLARVMRVFKLAKYNAGFHLMLTVMRKSVMALNVLFFLMLLGMVIFGALIFFAEQGTWDPASGRFLRPTGASDDLEISPFDSIPTAFWFVIVTMTTVGFGDVYPTTPVGRAIAAFTMMSGVLTLALPITVIGSNFASEYSLVEETAVFKKLLAVKMKRIRNRHLQRMLRMKLHWGFSKWCEESPTRHLRATMTSAAQAIAAMAEGDETAMAKFDADFEQYTTEVLWAQLSEAQRLALAQATSVACARRCQGSLQEMEWRTHRIRELQEGVLRPTSGKRRPDGPAAGAGAAAAAKGGPSCGYGGAGGAAGVAGAGGAGRAVAAGAAVAAVAAGAAVTAGAAAAAASGLSAEGAHMQTALLLHIEAHSPGQIHIKGHSPGQRPGKHRIHPNPGGGALQPGPGPEPAAAGGAASPSPSLALQQPAGAALPSEVAPLPSDLKPLPPLRLSFDDKAKTKVQQTATSEGGAQGGAGMARPGQLQQQEQDSPETGSPLAEAAVLAAVQATAAGTQLEVQQLRCEVGQLAELLRALLVQQPEERRGQRPPDTDTPASDTEPQ
jgi:hypothetical protein